MLVSTFLYFVTVLYRCKGNIIYPVCTCTCTCRRDGRVLMNSQGGHILRTKPVTTNEGGVAIGAGSLDSPGLVPSGEFLRLVCTEKE